MLRSYQRLFPVVMLLVVFATGSMAARLDGDTPEKPAAAPAASRLLTKHENETFTNQTVYISGQAFIHCKFVACTLVLRESTYHLEGNNFERCNWHVDVLIGWGDPSMIKELKDLATLMEEAQQKRSDK